MRVVEAKVLKWGDREFDANFNHRNNGHSVLRNIEALADLDESCCDAKRALMRAVVANLDGARSRGEHTDDGWIPLVDPLIRSLGDVLFEDPEYLRGYDAFASWLLVGLLGDGSKWLDEGFNDGGLSDAGLSDATLEALGGYASRQLQAKGVEAIKEHSVAIYQLLNAMRARAASAEVDDKWTVQSRALHAQYCEVLKGALPSLMDGNGVYQNERMVLAEHDDDPDAFPLISADGRSCVIMTSEHYGKLDPSNDSKIIIKWDRVRCAQVGPDGTFPASVAPAPGGGPGDGGTRGTEATAAVLDRFPLLRAARRRDDATEELGRMLSLAGLTEDLLQRFKAALQRTDTYAPNEKMTGDAAQLALHKIFKKKYEDRDGAVHLVAAHFAELQAQWPDDTEKAFAFRLLCMGALYTRYSSSHVFGTGLESPNALRGYAEALLRKAHELNPEVLPEDPFKDWVNRLKGNAYDCTALLYHAQSNRLDALLGQEPVSGPLHRVRDDMIPLAWR
jgi:hypothetical protein